MPPDYGQETIQVFSQHRNLQSLLRSSCFVSQRYRKMKSSKGKARRFGVAKAIQNLRAVGKEITKAVEEGLKDDFLKSFKET